MKKAAVVKTKTKVTGKTSTKDPVPAANELILGVVVDINSAGAPLINYPNNSSESPVQALSTVPVGKEAIGRQVAVMFAGGDFQQPVVIGLIRNTLDIQAEQQQAEQDAQPMEADITDELIANNQSLNVKVDDEKLVLSAEKEIVLQCGKSSITLTKAGKVLIRGAYLLNRSSGVNRIKGAAVQIN